MSDCKYPFEDASPDCEIHGKPTPQKASPTEQELRDKGWQKWSSDKDRNGNILMLCPIDDFKNVPDGTVMESINGDFVTKGKDYMDDDTRGGLLAFGLRVNPTNLSGDDITRQSQADTDGKGKPVAVSSDSSPSQPPRTTQQELDEIVRKYADLLAIDKGNYYDKEKLFRRAIEDATEGCVDIGSVLMAEAIAKSYTEQSGRFGESDKHPCFATINKMLDTIANLRQQFQWIEEARVHIWPNCEWSHKPDRIMNVRSWTVQIIDPPNEVIQPTKPTLQEALDEAKKLYGLLHRSSKSNTQS